MPRKQLKHASAPLVATYGVSKKQSAKSARHHETVKALIESKLYCDAQNSESDNSNNGSKDNRCHSISGFHPG